MLARKNSSLGRQACNTNTARISLSLSVYLYVQSSNKNVITVSEDCGRCVALDLNVSFHLVVSLLTESQLALTQCTRPYADDTCSSCDVKLLQ